MEINVGVQQGSILGPLLFLLFINDLPQIVQDNSKIALFADDTTLLTSGSNLEIEEKLNNDLKKIENWSSRNKLVINSKKCKIVGFGRNVQKSKNLLSGEVLEEVNSFKYLGVFIDKHLNFDPHIEYVGKTLAKFNGMLFRARNFFTKTFLLQMYNSYAKPMISYGILAYGSAKKTKLSSIFCLQKRILKTIFFKKRGDHVCYLFKRYNVLSVFDLYFDALVKEILDQIAKVSPLNFLDVDSNRPNTRASIKSLIPLPKFKTHTQKKSLRFSIIKMFNYLAKESLLPKQVSKEQIFLTRTKLRAYYLDNEDVFDLFF